MMNPRKKAEQMGINPDGIDTVDLIRIIQVKEGFIPCYRTGKINCPRKECAWRNSCYNYFHFEVVE
jgi:hypothetical protein